MTIDEKTKDKIKGAFFGAAIGDALGVAGEFLTKKDLQDQFPGGLRDFSQLGASRSWQAGEWTDDTEQALCVAQTLMAKGQIDSLWLAHRLNHWLVADGRGCGRHTHLVLTHKDFLTKPEEAALAVWKMEDERSNAANGSIMRNFPTGLWDFWSLETVFRNSEKACLTTHYDPRCLKSCLLHSFLLSRLLLEPEKLEKAGTIQDLANGMDPDDKDLMDAVAYQPDIRKLRLGTKIGYTYRALSAAMWALYCGTSVEHGIASIISEGGDTDTNACVAGAVLGCKFGFNAISQHLVDGLVHKEVLQANVDRFIAEMEKRAT